MNKRQLSRITLQKFGLKWNPFSSLRPVESLYPDHRSVYFCSRITSLVERGGFALLTGEPGAGKSTTLRMLSEKLSLIPDVMVGSFSRPQSTMNDFYREIGSIFGVKLSPYNRYCGFNSLREYWKSHIQSTLTRPVLLVDEATMMPPSVLSELRILSSTEFDSKSVLTIVLCGDERMQHKLASDELRPLASRIRVNLKMEPLPVPKMKEYILHSLEACGRPDLLSASLIDVLAEQSMGNYRALSNIGSEILEYGASKDASILDEKLFMELYQYQMK
jgi:type II secretory pathway predicted ATPase ExeA